jgi:hypothetical protein
VKVYVDASRLNHEDLTDFLNSNNIIELEIIGLYENLKLED